MSIIVIGASTGGINVLTWMISQFPKDYPFPILVAQHIPDDMPMSYIDRIDSVSKLNVAEGYQNAKLYPGCVYFSPAGYHMLVESTTHICLSTDPRVSYARPSIDVLFQSAADAFKSEVISIVLTGANTDGVAGAKYIKRYGGTVLVQNTETAEIPIMPEAVKNALELPPELCLSPKNIVDYLIKII